MERKHAVAATKPRQVGEGEIRTPETRKGPAVFKTAAFNRSATSPRPANADFTRVSATLTCERTGRGGHSVAMHLKNPGSPPPVRASREPRLGFCQRRGNGVDRALLRCSEGVRVDVERGRGFGMSHERGDAARARPGRDSRCAQHFDADRLEPGAEGAPFGAVACATQSLTRPRTAGRLRAIRL